MNTDTLQRPAPQTEPLQAPPPQAVGNQSEGSSAMGEIKEAAGNQARQISSDVKESASGALRSAKDAGNKYVVEQKEKIAARIDDYTEAVRAASERLRADEKNQLAVPADKASEQLHRVADYLRSKEPIDMINDLGDFARRRPELFYGTLFVAGLATVRFLKASSREQNEFRSNGRSSPRNEIYQPRDFQREPSYTRSPEPAPDLAPVGPSPALETNNPSFVP